jgi:hypothetical protein
MNERIRELMDQAGELAYEEHKAKCLKNGLDPMMPFGNNLMAIMEKFAELIVEKCADVAKYHTPDTEECEYTWLIHDKIKAHFGVEE